MSPMGNVNVGNILVDFLLPAWHCVVSDFKFHINKYLNNSSKKTIAQESPRQFGKI